MSPRSSWRAAMLATSWILALAACGSGETAPVEPLPAEGLPRAMEDLLIENVAGCRENEDCAGGVCRFGACLALVRLDAPWQVPTLMARVTALIETHPQADELRRRVVDTLVRLIDEGAALAFRARAIQGLEALGVAAPIAQRFETLPEPLQEEAAVTLTRLGDPKGLALTLALTESDELPVAIAATRALGRAGAMTSEARAEVLPTLLGLLSLEVDLELQRATLDALGELGDARAIQPLAAWLRTGSDALGDRTAMALRTLAKPDRPLPPDAAQWDAWLAAHPAPAPPPYTPRAGKHHDDGLDLPDP